jgi:hypothetical protein
MDLARIAISFTASGGTQNFKQSSFNQSIDESRLSLQHPPSRVGDTKPSRAVDLRKGPSASRALRPLHLEGIAANERGIPVALDGPRLNDLAAWLPCLAEREEISVRIVSGLFDEFAPTPLLREGRLGADGGDWTSGNGKEKRTRRGEPFSCPKSPTTSGDHTSR